MACMKFANINRAWVSVMAGVVTALLVLTGTAFAATYETTGTLNHGGYCIGYGWGDSQHPYGVYSGTSQTGGGGPCYRKQDAKFYYNSGSIFDPPSTGYQTYNLAQGAGPGGSCDWEDTWHFMSWTGGDLGAPNGRTTASDC